MKTIIIGAGAAGLTAAAYLSAKGANVTVVEQSDTIGGALRHARKDGYEFSRDYLLQRFLPGQFFSDFLQGYGKELDTVRTAQRYVFPDFTLEKPEGAKQGWMKELLIRRFPRQARGIRGLYGFADRMQNIAAAQEKIEKNNSSSLKLSVIWNFLLVNRHVDKRCDQLLGSFLKDEELIRVLSSVLLEKGVKSDEFAGIGLPLLLSESLFDDAVSLAREKDLADTGACQIVGGTEKLMQALREVIEEHGGTILTGKTVKKIRIQDSVVRGVFLDDNSYLTGQEGEALAVIMTGGARESLIRLVGKEYLKADTVEKLEGQKLRPAVFAVHLGIKAGLKLPKGVTHVCVDSADDAVEEIRQGIYDPATQGYVMYSSSAFGLAAPEGHESLTVLAFAPAKAQGIDYENDKERLTQELIALAEKQIPGLREAIETILVETPGDLAAQFALDTPCMGGFVNEAGQAALAHKLEARGLYLAGQFSGGGGGVGTVMRGAIQTAAAIVSDYFLDVAQEVEEEDDDDDEIFNS